MRIQKTQKIAKYLVDTYGTGRMIFRNRRSVLKGLPGRRLIPVELTVSPDYDTVIKKLQKHLVWEGSYLNFDVYGLTPSKLKQTQSEAGKIIKTAWETDPRIKWLIHFTKSLKKGEKVLLICNSKTKVLAIQNTLRSLTKLIFTTFHEDLPLNIRDKNAADFSKPEGVNLMICSEIGSEGRNFQFSHKLILFDLPLNTELLEQRIGRLHRIGQKSEIEIYLPYVKGSSTQILVEWYFKGLNSFVEPMMGSNKILDSCMEILEELASSMFFTDDEKFRDSIESLINKTHAEKIEIEKLVDKGRNRLLEINSSETSTATNIIDQINAEEETGNLEDYLENMFEMYGVNFTSLAEKKAFQIFPGSEMLMDSFPSLPEEGLFITLDRPTSLIREDLSFFSWDHPIITGGMDLILGSQDNTTTVAEWHNTPENNIVIEFVFMLEPLADKEFEITDYLCPTPIQIAIDISLKSREDLYPDINFVKLKKGNLSSLQKRILLRKTFFQKC